MEILCVSAESSLEVAQRLLSWLSTFEEEVRDTFSKCANQFLEEASDQEENVLCYNILCTSEEYVSLWKTYGGSSQLFSAKMWAMTCSMRPSKIFSVLSLKEEVFEPP